MDITATDHSAEYHAVQNASRNEIVDIILSLPKRHREVVVLRVQEDMTFSEIAALLGGKESTIRVRYKRALQMIRMSLQEELVFAWVAYHGQHDDRRIPSSSESSPGMTKTHTISHTGVPTKLVRLPDRFDALPENVAYIAKALDSLYSQRLAQDPTVVSLVKSSSGNIDTCNRWNSLFDCTL